MFPASKRRYTPAEVAHPLLHQAEVVGSYTSCPSTTSLCPASCPSTASPHLRLPQSGRRRGPARANALVGLERGRGGEGGTSFRPLLRLSVVELKIDAGAVDLEIDDTHVAGARTTAAPIHRNPQSAVGLGPGSGK